MKKLPAKVKIISIVALAVFQLVFLIDLAKAEGASLYVSPSSGTFPLGSEFDVAVKIDSGGEAINSADGSLNFDKEKIRVADIYTDNSIFNFWFPERKPTYSNETGKIIFSGGLPSPGFNGSAGILLTIRFKAVAVGTAQINFTAGSILANDGKGSNILTAMGNAAYIIAPKSEAPQTEPADSSGAENNSSPASKQDIPDAEIDSSIIFSDTHPDQNAWYPLNKAVIGWKMPADAQGVSYLFNNNVNSEPEEKSEGQFESKTFDNVKDGVWYFHLKIKAGGKWSKTYRYRIQIDTTPPQMLETYINQADSDNWPILFFRALDDLSGMLKYEIKIGSLEEKGYTVEETEGTLSAQGLSPGEHTALIKAIDKAGNETYTEITFNIQPLPAPEINDHSLEIRPAEKIFFSGKSIADGTLTVYIEDGNGKVETRTTRSDSGGNWYLVHDNGLANGRYIAWVQAENANGLQSDPSAKVSFIVSPPVFASIGNFVLNYFTVLVSLLFMIVLVAASVVFLVYFVRQKLRKETFEIEKVLDEKLLSLKNEIDREFSVLGQISDGTALRAERTRARKRIDEKIKSAEEKIRKEIRDVEDIIK